MPAADVFIRFFAFSNQLNLLCNLLGILLYSFNNSQRFLKLAGGPQHREGQGSLTCLLIPGALDSFPWFREDAPAFPIVFSRALG